MNLPLRRSLSACDKPGVTKPITLSPIPAVVWQQLSEITRESLTSVKTKNYPTAVSTDITQTPEPKDWNDIEKQLSSPTGTLLWKWKKVRNRSGKVAEQKVGKPGTNWRSFPVWSASWSGILRLTIPSLQRLKPTWGFWNSDRSWRRQFLLLPWNFFRKTKKGALHKSVQTSQIENHCDNWNRSELLALQQLVNKSNSSNFHNNINRDCKLLNVLTTTMPTFDGKSENVELFENQFETSLIIHK